MPRPKRLIQVLLSLAVMLGASACSERKFMKVEDIPVPPTAHAGELEGAYEVALRTSVSAALRELKEKYGKAESKIYFLAPETDWTSVSGFYDNHLRPQNMKRDASFAEEHSGYRLAVWSDGSPLGKQAIAAALVETTPSADARPQKFLAVFLAGE